MNSFWRRPKPVHTANLQQRHNSADTTSATSISPSSQKCSIRLCFDLRRRHVSLQRATFQPQHRPNRCTDTTPDSLKVAALHPNHDVSRERQCETQQTRPTQTNEPCCTLDSRRDRCCPRQFLGPSMKGRNVNGATVSMKREGLYRIGSGHKSGRSCTP